MDKGRGGLRGAAIEQRDRGPGRIDGDGKAQNTAVTKSDMRDEMVSRMEVGCLRRVGQGELEALGMLGGARWSGQGGGIARGGEGEVVEGKLPHLIEAASSKG